ncbi:hypothetical protein Mx8p61 [Myxococcus phage Mx8]|uniref:p61 n=1 Tax=Myxococcus phage Mx8 TaxID=49964 RepID=Q94MQ8_9CAUD|nr:hypothetical protein Mx8p61 [Myxococcus phage Mx8]AAK94396.1 p61 [Myxococcus phage Mx8]
MFPLRVRQAQYDERFSGREPSALTERVKKASSEQNRSVNETRVTFTEIGVAAYEWMQAHAAELLAGGGASQEADDLVRTLLAEALEARKKPKK